MEGLSVGISDGIAVVGIWLGASVDDWEGPEGEAVGSADGPTVLGTELEVGRIEGFSVGSWEGRLLGIFEDGNDVA